MIELLFTYGDSILTSIGIFTFVWKLFPYLKRQLELRALSKDLHPFYSKEEIIKATRYFIQTNCQNVPPSNEIEPGNTFAHATKERLIPFFIKKVFKPSSSSNRYYFLLADSGMGKTTFMINLYFNYVLKVWGKSYELMLLPLGHPDIDEAFENIKNFRKKKTILLLDALDEDNKAVLDYRKRLDEILHKTVLFRKVIITCRTQFFPSEIEEPGQTGIMKYGGDKGFYEFQKFYISPFDEIDIKKYLRMKFSIFNFEKRLSANKIIKNCPQLAVRPMLLNYIEDLVQSKNNYTYSYEIYEQLIQKWIEREANRKTENEAKTFKVELYNFSQSIAKDMYEHKFDRNGLFIFPDDISQFAHRHAINLDSLEMKSRSLLNRNSEGNFKFSHRSIMEYFLMIELINNSEFQESFNYDGFDQARTFYNEAQFKKHSKKYFEKLIMDLSKDNSSADNVTFFVDKVYNSETIHSIKLDKLFFATHISCPNKSIVEIKHFEVLDKLSTLDLSFNKIKSIKGIYMNNLLKLDLKYNKLENIDDIKLNRIASLDLSHNRITNVKALYKLKTLKELYLNNNKIPPEQIELLTKKLPDCKIITDTKHKSSDYWFWWHIELEKSRKILQRDSDK